MTNGAVSWGLAWPEMRAQSFQRLVVVRRSAWASSATITSQVWSLTFSSRSQVITTHSSPPSPSAVMVRHQWPIVIAAGRSATTSTRCTPRRSPTAVAPRTAEIVLPTPGSSASRNCRPPAAARSAIASAASNWSRRGSSVSLGSGEGAGSSGLRVFSTNRPSVCGPGAYGARCAGSARPT